MPTGSKRYNVLSIRLNQLSKHLLGFIPAPPFSHTTYSDQELDYTRAYVLLVHAEIEAFCEELALEKAKAMKAEYDQRGNIKAPLKKIVTYYVGKKGRSWRLVASPTSDLINSAFEAYKQIVRDNHGLKQSNIECLFYPLGVHDGHLSNVWLAQMNSFGAQRGGWAHTSTRAQQPPDPLSQRQTVTQLLQGLLELDRVVSNLR